jgi:hypothetical protein
VGGGDPGEPLDDPHAAIDRIAHSVPPAVQRWSSISRRLPSELLAILKQMEAKDTI